MALLMERVAGMAGVFGVEMDLDRNGPSLLAVRSVEAFSAAQLGDRLANSRVHVMITDLPPAELQRTFTGRERELHPVA